MEFKGLGPITVKPQIELFQNGQAWDLHNCADFIGYQYDRNNATLILTWDYGCDCEGVVGGEIYLKFIDVTKTTISEVDPDVPRSEDLCLTAISLTSQNTIYAEFRGGRTFNISCGSVVFDSNETNGHRQT